MKNLRLIILFLTLFLSLQSFAALKAPNRWDSQTFANGMRINAYPRNYLIFKTETMWEYYSAYYMPSLLTPEQRFDILGIPNEWNYNQIQNHTKKNIYSGKDESPGGGNKSMVERMFYRSIHYTLGITYSSSDSPRWNSLAEKRYSTMRDLFTELSQLPGMDGKWTAYDYILPDGSHVFSGDAREMLVIEAKTGDIYHGNEYRSFLDSGKNGELDHKQLRKLSQDRLFCSYQLRP